MSAIKTKVARLEAKRGKDDELVTLEIGGKKFMVTQNQIRDVFKRVEPTSDRLPTPVPSEGYNGEDLRV